MLTLKVVELSDIEGFRKVHLFTAERIVHVEHEHTDHTLEAYSSVQIGELSNPDSKQQFNTSFVQLYSTDKALKQDIFIFPNADCFIMENGKTVDTFSAK